MPDAILTGDAAKRAAALQRATEREIHSRETATQNRHSDIPFEGWEKQKQSLVVRAFDRIIEHEWYDKFENNLKDVERIHINSVREHYAMRRDRVKTPAPLSAKGGNCMNSHDWAANMEALEILNGETNVQTFFRGLVGRRRYANANR